jgi:hypothetical protein
MKRTTKDMRPRGYTAVQLRRVDKARNMARFCCLAVQQNLFGVWWFVREFGRIGSPGRVMQPPTSLLHGSGSWHLGRAGVGGRPLR